MSDSATAQSEGAASAAPSASHGSGLDLVGLTKVFPGGMVAVDDVNLHVDHGEYVVLLGPSGCACSACCLPALVPVSLAL